MNLGLMHLYTGDGKGKTTAAVGLAVRAAGDGVPVLFVQFLKNQPTGELESFGRLPNLRVLRGKAGEGFTFTMTREEKERTAQIHNQNLREALEAARRGECGLLVLDEALGALSCGLLDEGLLREVVEKRPPQVELVLTGRKPPEWLVAAADYVTEMRKVKHPYDKGVQAREGVEY